MEEISWFGQNQIELLYNCDANYGLFSRDQELTEYLVNTKKSSDSPPSSGPPTQKTAMPGQNWGEYKEEFGDVLWPNEEASFLELVCHKPGFHDDLLGFLNDRIDAGVISVEPDLLNDLLSFQKHSVIGPHTPAEFSFDLRFNLHEYFDTLENGSVGRLSRDPHTLTAATDTVFNGDLALYTQQMVWYGRKSRSRRTGIPSDARGSGVGLALAA